MDIWTWTPTLDEFIEGVTTKTLISDMGGREKRIGVGDPRRTFEFTFSSVDEETATKMYDFFVAHRGQMMAFFFMHPKDPHPLIKCRFNMSDISKKSFLFTVVEVGIKLIEVIE